MISEEGRTKGGGAMPERYEAEARIFQALSDPRRLAILAQLRGGEQCACVLLEKLAIGQSGLSYHMKILCESGLVESRQEGKWTHYHLSAEGRKQAVRLLETLTTPFAEQASDSCGCNAKAI